MSTHEPEQARPTPLTSMPRIEDVPFVEHGYEPDQVRSAFDSFQRHVAQLQAQLRVLQAAGSASIEPSGHAVRMDALHLIRAAAEFADALEGDAQSASAAQLARIEEEIRTRQQDIGAREADVERYRQESDRQRQEILGAARNESRELLANAQRDATQELREAEARGNRLLEQARHQATELTNSARAEVEGTLEWARAQAASVMMRAQQGAERLLGAAGLGDDQIHKVAASIVQAAEEQVQAARSPGGVVRQPAIPPTTSPAVTPPAAVPATPVVSPRPEESEEAPVPAAIEEPEEAPESEETSEFETPEEPQAPRAFGEPPPPTSRTFEEPEEEASEPKALDEREDVSEPEAAADEEGEAEKPEEDEAEKPEEGEDGWSWGSEEEDEEESEVDDDEPPFGAR